MKTVIFEKTIKKLEENGENITPIRKKIIRILFENKQPLTSRDILNKINQSGISAHRATVYRDIDFCEKKGLVNSYTFKNKPVIFYEFAGEHHHHIICDSCGKIEYVCPDEIEHAIDAFETKLYKEKKFKINSHRMKFYGLCEECN